MADESTAVPQVTVVIPAHDEAADIPRCLAAVVAQDVEHSAVEVIVVDSASTDDTATVAAAALRDGGFARADVVRSDAAATPAALNRGLAEARGEFLVRVDARSIVPPDYVRRCVELLREDAGRRVVGGAQVAVPRDGTPTAIGIARALNNRWGMGLSKYRRGAPSGPTDTVYLGAFRTEELRAAGGWDERFATNQDFELNRRMGRDGIVWFESGLDVGYLPRRGIGALFRQYRRFGQWKVRYWRTTGDRPRPRQLALLAVAPTWLLGLVVLPFLPSGRRRALLAAAAAGALVFEVAGSDRTGDPLASHAVGLAGSAAVAAGWSLGAWESLLRPGPAGPPSGPDEAVDRAEIRRDRG